MIAFFSLVLLLGIGDGNNLRLWFSTTGVAENEPINGTPAEYISPTEGVNPTPTSDGTTRRLYLWKSILSLQQYHIVTGISLNIHLDALAGNTRFVGRQFYNYRAGSYRRWGGIVQGTLTDAYISNVALISVAAEGLGEETGPFDPQYDAVTRSYLLGYVDVHAQPGAQASVSLAVGPSGISTDSIHLDYVYLGWGDARLRGTAYNQRSAQPDAFIVPEPATLMLVVIGGAALCRR